MPAALKAALKDISKMYEAQQNEAPRQAMGTTVKYGYDGKVVGAPVFVSKLDTHFVALGRLVALMTSNCIRPIQLFTEETSMSGRPNHETTSLARCGYWLGRDIIYAKQHNRLRIKSILNKAVDFGWRPTDDEIDACAAFLQSFVPERERNGGISYEQFCIAVKKIKQKMKQKMEQKMWQKMEQKIDSSRTESQFSLAA